jgi:hypothetical protein
MKTINFLTSYIIFFLVFTSCKKDKSDNNLTPNNYVCDYSYSNLTFNPTITTLTSGESLEDAIVNAESGDIIELEPINM